MPTLSLVLILISQASLFFFQVGGAAPLWKQRLACETVNPSIPWTTQIVTLLSYCKFGGVSRLETLMMVLRVKEFSTCEYTHVVNRLSCFLL